MSQGVREFSVIAFLWAVCSGVGKTMLMFQKHSSLTIPLFQKESNKQELHQVPLITLLILL